MEAAMPTAKPTRRRQAHELKNLFMRESPLVGSKTSWKGTKNRADGYGAAARARSPQWRPTSRLGSCPKTFASSVPMLQKAPIGKGAHESGKTDPGVERFAPPETSNWG